MTKISFVGGIDTFFQEILSQIVQNRIKGDKSKKRVTKVGE